MAGAGFKSLRDLIKDLETIEGMTPYAKQRAALQAAECLRVAFNALREIAWLPDLKKESHNNLKRAKCDAMVAMKKCKVSAEDFSQLRPLAEKFELMEENDG